MTFPQLKTTEIDDDWYRDHVTVSVLNIGSSGHGVVNITNRYGESLTVSRSMLNRIVAAVEGSDHLPERNDHELDHREQGRPDPEADGEPGQAPG